MKTTLALMEQRLDQIQNAIPVARGENQINELRLLYDRLVAELREYVRDAAKAARRNVA